MLWPLIILSHSTATRIESWSPGPGRLNERGSQLMMINIEIYFKCHIVRKRFFIITFVFCPNLCKSASQFPKKYISINAFWTGGPLLNLTKDCVPPDPRRTHKPAGEPCQELSIQVVYNLDFNTYWQRFYRSSLSIGILLPKNWKLFSLVRNDMNVKKVTLECGKVIPIKFWTNKSCSLQFHGFVSNHLPISMIRTLKMIRSWITVGRI